MKKLILPALPLMLVLTTCQTLSSIVREPSVFLKSMDIAGINLNGVDLIAHVNIENPNSFSIPMPKIDWELFLNAAHFTQGTLKGGDTIRGNGSTTMALPLSFTYDGLYRSFASLVGTKEAAYKVALGVSFPLPIIEEKIYNLDFSGILPLPQLPRLSGGQVSISKMDFTGIELACGINVENPNVFSIPFPGIHWDYQVNGISIVKSSLAGAGEIAAAAVSAAHFNVGFTYTDLFRLVSSARNAAEARGNLSVTMDSTGFPQALLGNIGSALNIPGNIPILQR